MTNNGTDLYGFSGKAISNRSSMGNFTSIGEICVFVSSSETALDNWNWQGLLDSSDLLENAEGSKKVGISVRCLKN